MSTIPVEFVMLDESGELDTLKTANWQAVPRVGEHVSLGGPSFGEGETQDDSITAFTVGSVEWRSWGAGCEARIVLDPVDARFKRRCTCGPERKRSSTANLFECEDCGHRIARYSQQYSSQDAAPCPVFKAAAERVDAERRARESKTPFRG